VKNKLDLIIDQKRFEVAELSQNALLRQIVNEGRAGQNLHQLRNVLRGPHLSVIAEVKKRSPSAGAICLDLDPALQAQHYFQGGASAISVLTDRKFFGGILDDLKKVRNTLPDIPVLRKDFVIDPLQVAEAALAGATAVLLIVAVLGSSTRKRLQEVQKMGLEALVEVHDRKELEIAVEAGAEIIGVNCRNLKTFDIDLDTAEKLALYIPRGVIKVAESGIKTAEDAKMMRRAGYDAVLVGEALVRSQDPSQLIKEMRGASDAN
jgi:indole-3-glycerol phosphate synthase